MGLKNFNKFVLNMITLGDYGESEELFDKLKKFYEQEYKPLENKNQEYIKINTRLVSKLYRNKSNIVNKFEE